MDLKKLTEDRTNFVFIGEAGCGKSEIALNLAYALHEQGGKPVHFFDLDMTKPLFRSRDLAEKLRSDGIHVHYEEQFMDAPTVGGGVRRLMQDQDCYVVMDVGGDYIGARSIGGYAPLLNRPETGVFYVINPYRVWAMDLEHIDMVLGETLGVSHVQLQKLQLIGNANLGRNSSAEEVIAGSRQLAEQVAPYIHVTAHCVWETLYPTVAEEIQGDIWPIRLYLTYPWASENAL